MNGRFVIVASSVSAPGTMGGNTKIALEIARNLLQLGVRVAVVVPMSKRATFTGALPEGGSIEYVEIADFIGNDMHRPISSTRHFCREVSRAFEILNVGPDDVVYASCNFHYDIIPMVREKRWRHFRYVATHYLFTPFVFENIFRRYRFPVLKYLLVWFYERTFFLVNRFFADAFVITNDDDRRYFGKGWQNRLFAIYGGVNVEQIPLGNVEKTRDVVFCSRLHPQKGVEGLLEAWKLVRERLPTARLTLIGNGAADYEAKLRRKASALDLSDSLEWLGYVNNEAKYEIYRSAKVFAHATVYDNNGMVAAEALCSGLPVVMYDLPALKDVYTEGCLKVPRGSIKAYAAALVSSLTDPAAIAPTREQVASLREMWNWPNRVRALAAFLEGVHAS